MSICSRAGIFRKEPKRKRIHIRLKESKKFGLKGYYNGFSLLKEDLYPVSPPLQKKKPLQCPMKKSKSLIVLYPDMRFFFGRVERFMGQRNFFRTTDTQNDLKTDFMDHPMISEVFCLRAPLYRVSQKKNVSLSQNTFF